MSVLRRDSQDGLGFALVTTSPGISVAYLAELYFLLIGQSKSRDCGELQGGREMQSCQVPRTGETHHYLAQGEGQPQAYRAVSLRVSQSPI